LVSLTGCRGRSRGRNNSGVGRVLARQSAIDLALALHIRLVSPSSLSTTTQSPFPPSTLSKTASFLTAHVFDAFSGERGFVHNFLHLFSPLNPPRNSLHVIKSSDRQPTSPQPHGSAVQREQINLPEQREGSLFPRRISVRRDDPRSETNRLHRSKVSF
jgi:hypothetical protein